MNCILIDIFGKWFEDELDAPPPPPDKKKKLLSLELVYLIIKIKTMHRLPGQSVVFLPLVNTSLPGRFIFLISCSYPDLLFLYVSGIYFCLNMMIITLSTFLAVTIINLHIRADKRNRVPGWVRRVGHYNGCLLSLRLFSLGHLFPGSTGHECYSSLQL